MKVLTYTPNKENCELYTEIHVSIAVNSCHIELVQKDMILLSKVSIIVYEAGKSTSVENKKFKDFNLSAGTYSIDDFNAKIKVTILQREDWEPPQIKDLKLVISEHYTFMVDNTIFIALGIPDNYREKTTLIKSTLSPCSYKTSLDTSPPQKSLSLNCKQINKVKNELDGQPSSLLAGHLDFKILDENSYEVIPKTFYLQLLNKE